MNIEEAPKDILRYAGRFLDLKDMMTCRIVCKRWKEIIDDGKHDNYLFQHFTLENENVEGNRIYYQAAKNAYIVEKNFGKPPVKIVKMDEYVPINGGKRKCCKSLNCCSGSCCGSNGRGCFNCDGYDSLACCAIFIACITCCCCCCCCGTQKTFPLIH